MKLCVIDTETVGLNATEVFDFGYQIVEMQDDGSFKVLKARSYVNEHIDNTMLMRNDQFCGDGKYNKYLELLKSGGVIKHSTEFILNKLKQDLDGIDMVFAYNCAFDKRQITNMALKYEMENPLDGKQVKDIWGYATNFITNTQEYREWADGRQEYTESQRFISQSAESVYRFMTGDGEFVEEHMALADSRIETEILAECLKRGAKLDGNYKVNKYLPNGKILTDNLVLPDGQELEINYTKKTNRNGKTYYKM